MIFKAVSSSGQTVHHVLFGAVSPSGRCSVQNLQMTSPFRGSHPRRSFLMAQVATEVAMQVPMRPYPTSGVETCMRMIHGGGPAFRWTAPKPSPSLVAMDSFDLGTEDYCLPFVKMISTACKPLAIYRVDVLNERQLPAEVFILSYKKPSDEIEKYYHGTHLGSVAKFVLFGAVRQILTVNTQLSKTYSPSASVLVFSFSSPFSRQLALRGRQSNVCFGADSRNSRERAPQNWKFEQRVRTYFNCSS